MKAGNINYHPDSRSLKIVGDWTIFHISSADINRAIEYLQNPSLYSQNHDLTVSIVDISVLDRVGAYFLVKLINQLKQKYNIIHIDANHHQQQILQNIDQELVQLTKNEQLKPVSVYKTGSWYHNLCLGLEFSVDLIYYNVTTLKKMLYALLHFYNLPIVAIANNIINLGCKAIPLVILLSFLIGVNLTYQLAPQFSNYGASIYVVNFLGIALFREVIPLLTAILIVARSGSAITTTLGSMKLQEEIDALIVMGINPIYRLVIPQLISLLLAVPILTVIADCVSMLGGMIVAYNQLNISNSLFISRLQQQVAINQYIIGIVKSFIFAWLISIVSSFLGLQVKDGADNLGRSTTHSVVLSIVLIIFFDALLAIICSIMNV